MIPADTPSTPNEPDPKHSPLRSSQRRDPDEDLWDLDAAEAAAEDGLPEALPEDPLKPAPTDSSSGAVPVRPEPRAMAEAENVRSDLNAVKKPKEARPVRPLVSVKGDFDPLDELTGFGELQEPDVPPARASARSAEPEPSRPAHNRRAPEPLEESSAALDTKSAVEVSEAPFESPVQEEDNRETLLKELQNGWLPGLGFLVQRIRAFSFLEQLSCVLILIGIIGFSSAVFFPALLGFPQSQEFLESRDFPVRGSHIVVTDAETYWRKPITDGAEADTVRMGVALLPVVDLKFKTDPGMIRLLFRNSEGRLVGDPITRAVKGEQFLSLSATTGLADTGMFSAYRTGEMEPWVVEVFEARGNNTSSDAFEPVFKMTIAPILK